jgi:transposase
MSEVTTIGLDLAKLVFQVHGVDAEGATVLRKQLRRAQVLAFFSRLRPCLVGLEACATAHYWARELRALGHEVRYRFRSSDEASVRGLHQGQQSIRTA